jgi:hypothetical protein
MTMRTNKFTKGSGCYKCECCGRLTRDDGNGDSVHVRLCSECYEYAGLENELADGNSPDLERMEELRVAVLYRGGNADGLKVHVHDLQVRNQRSA